jgi:peptidoglycan-associated lipoprotein
LDRRNRILVPVVLLVALVAVAGCKKKMAQPPAAAIAPAAVAPTAEITASPTVITAGDRVMLTWSTTNATRASIDGLGDVPTSGVKTVTPTVSTTYHLVAKGAGGSWWLKVREARRTPLSALL